MKKIIILLLMIANIWAYQTKELNPQMQKAFKANQKGDYKTSIAIFKKEAAKGNPVACESLGECYMWGIGVKQDADKSIYYFKKAIDQNKNTPAKISAIVNLGNLYRILGKNKEAYVYYKRAIEMGSPNGMRHLGEMYAYGKLGKVDKKKAKYWYKKAAKLNDVIAMTELGTLYYFGKDYKNALKYFSKAYNLGERDTSANFIGLMYYDGQGLKKDYKKAARFLQESVKTGNPMAMNMMGILYVTGRGVSQDKIKAYKVWMKAAKLGLKNAQDNLDRLCKESPWACQK